VLNFINVILKFLAKRREQTQEEHKNFFPKTNVDLNAKMIFFEELGLQQIKVNFSFANIPSIDRFSDSVVSRWLRTGGALANIDSAPVLLHGLLMMNPFTTRQELIHRILKHYLTAGISELHKVLGSADILGSPLSLINSLGTGIYDFFYEPYRGLQQSYYGFIVGMAKGTESLFKNSFFGVFNTTTKITGTLGKGRSSFVTSFMFMFTRLTIRFRHFATIQR